MNQIPDVHCIREIRGSFHGVMNGELSCVDFSLSLLVTQYINNAFCSAVFQRVLEMAAEVPQHQPAAVAVETSEGIDPSNLQLSELTSQKLEGEVSYSAAGEHAFIQHQKDLLESPPGTTQCGHGLI